MKTQIRKLVRIMAGWPLVGRLVRIVVAVIRLPEQNDRQHRFAEEQLPTLLSSLSDLNARVVAAGQDPDNLSQSMPVTLRMLARDIAELRTRLEGLERARLGRQEQLEADRKP